MSAPKTFRPLLCVVDFHHARGPEIEHWIGDESNIDPSVENDWSLIPYMALPDGAHTSTEEFSYFTLVYKAKEGADVEPTSVFGISCTQQLDASELLFRPADVTRSAVQKAVVAITDQPQSFSAWREKLSVVTRAWFAQRDFRDVEILQHFRDSLVTEHEGTDEERDQFFGLSLREIVHTYKWQTLVLLKCLLLQPKILFFGSNCEHVCQVQFSLLSLVPGLIRSLQDCAAPELDRNSATARKQDSVRTSDRASLLAYMGLPLNLFGKGSVFGPYTPLQQMDGLTANAQSYVLGTTNSLLLSQKERYSEVLINLDEHAVLTLAPALKAALTLTVADRRWIEFLTQAVNDTWDDADTSRPSTHGYSGSEEFIRLQFEEYLLAMLSAVKYHQYMHKHNFENKPVLTDIHGDPSEDFAPNFIQAWQQTENYRLWNRLTDDQLFDIVEPKHPCAGGITMEDIQRRVAAQVAELQLDARFRETRDVVGKRLADGRTTVSSAFSKVWADIETMRETQRKRSEESKSHAGEEKSAPAQLQHAQASVQAVGQRAGAYLSSWSTWASDKRKQGWTKSPANEKPPRV